MEFFGGVNDGAIEAVEADADGLPPYLFELVRPVGPIYYDPARMDDERVEVRRDVYVRHAMHDPKMARRRRWIYVLQGEEPPFRHGKK